MEKQSIMKNEKIIDAIILLIIFMASYCIYYAGIVNMQNVYNSDFAYYAIAGKDILSGNVILKGWYGATNTFYFMDLIYGIAGKIFGFGIDLIYIVSSMVWGAMVTVLSYFTIRLNKGNIKGKYIRVLFMIAICYSSCYLIQIDRILGGVHLDAFLLSLAFIWVSSHYEVEAKKKSVILYIAASICLIMAIISDELVMYFAVLPMAAVYAGRLFFYKKNNDGIKENILKLSCLLFNVVISKAILRVVDSVGGIHLNWQASNILFLNREEFFDRIVFYIEEIIYLFNADLFGQKVSPESFSLMLRFLFVVLIFAGLVASFHILKNSALNQILMTIIFVEACVVVFTNYIEIYISYTSRIMYYTFIALALLAIQIDLKHLYNILGVSIPYKAINIASVIFVGIVLLVGITGIQTTEETTEKNRYQKVVEILKEKGLTQGYGTFWLANATTLTSGCEINVSPASNSKDFSKYQWLSFDTERWDYANFVLVDDSNWDNITRDTIVESIGNPNEEIQVDNIIIMIWDKNIMPYINDSGAAEQIDYWCNLDEAETVKTIPVNNRHFYSVFEANENGVFTSNTEGQLVYGPFKNLKEGSYAITFVYSYDGGSSENTLGEKVIGYVDVFSNAGNIEYAKKDITAGDGLVTIENVNVYGNCTDAELRSYVYESGVSIKEIIIEKNS